MSDDICPRNMCRNFKSRQIFQINGMKMLRQIVGEAKVDRIRNQQIRFYCGIHLINYWVERREKEWWTSETMNAERLVKIAMDNTPEKKIGDAISDWNSQNHLGIQKSIINLPLFPPTSHLLYVCSCPVGLSLL